ncbi:TIGR02266 family protein [Corallococcus sp. AB011P]|uniref:TIGR02266 family protein n=1 Tax=unclassified Corallococcus TaxID=2685029 RepID=UPI000EA2907E|nr:MULTISPECIES: TIGR02266 family protein [unclassified Corallococcus]RKG51235.1 TIGR02266 family protein [Corallococcus sp. AB011P]RKH85464.1 TIGR02266 family protein [Corallococcus sp. AB045]
MTTPGFSPRPRDLVFVVDDSRTARDVMRLHLSRMGCDAVGLEGADACLAELAQRTPALILMDLHLEKLQGDEACRMVKAHPAGRNVPVVMFTAADEPHEVMHCGRAGADDFLPKPVSQEALAAKVAAVRLSRERAWTGPPRGRGVLLVEGGRFLHTFLGGALEHEGLHVLYAKDLDDAAAQAVTHGEKLDGFVVDVSRLPREALSLATRLREQFVRKPLVLMSRVEESPDVLARAQELSGAPLLLKRQLGADELLAKVLARLSPGTVPLRAAERVPFFTVVEFNTPGGPTLSGFSHDASPQGLFVRTLTPAREGSRLSLRLVMAGQRTPCEAQAVVAWCNPPGMGSAFRSQTGMGLRLEGMDAQLQQRFVRFVPQSLGFPTAGPVRASGF